VSIRKMTKYAILLELIGDCPGGAADDSRRILPTRQFFPGEEARA